MPIYALGDVVPDIDPEAWVHPDATVIGNVTIGAGIFVVGWRELYHARRENRLITSGPAAGDTPLTCRYLPTAGVSCVTCSA